MKEDINKDDVLGIVSPDEIVNISGSGINRMEIFSNDLGLPSSISIGIRNGESNNAQRGSEDYNTWDHCNTWSNCNWNHCNT